MHHVVLLLSALFVEVDAAVEDQITRLHLFELEVDRQRVILVGLVPTVKFEAKILTQIVHDLAHKGAAVEEDRCVVQGVTRVVIPFGVRDTEVLFAAVKELCTELALEFRIAPVLLRLCRHIIPVLDLFFFGLLEALEVVLQAARLLHTAEA